MPSAAPSCASQAALIALATRSRSALLNASARIGSPFAFFGAICVNLMLFHIAAIVAPLATRIAGAPAVIASK